MVLLKRKKRIQVMTLTYRMYIQKKPLKSFLKNQKKIVKMLWLIIEKSSQLVLPKEYKHFLCTNGTIQIHDPHGNNSFELWTPSKIISKSQSSLSVFIKRFEEPSHNGVKESQGQIPILKKGVVFASSHLRGSDEYVVYFFASSKPNEIAKIYAVEVKDGVWTDQYKNIQDFFTGVISEIDMDELTTG